MDWKEFFKTSEKQILITFIIFLIGFIIMKFIIGSYLQIGLACGAGDIECMEMLRENGVKPTIYSLIASFFISLIYFLIFRKK